MSIERHKKVVIETVSLMVNSYYYGDLKKCQGRYDYLRGYCDGANINFNNALDGALQYLIKNSCVGIEDTKKYQKYLKMN